MSTSGLSESQTSGERSWGRNIQKLPSPSPRLPLTPSPGPIAPSCANWEVSFLGLSPLQVLCVPSTAREGPGITMKGGHSVAYGCHQE